MILKIKLEVRKGCIQDHFMCAVDELVRLSILKEQPQMISFTSTRQRCLFWWLRHRRYNLCRKTCEMTVVIFMPHTGGRVMNFASDDVLMFNDNECYVTSSSTMTLLVTADCSLTFLFLALCVSISVKSFVASAKVF